MEAGSEVLLRCKVRGTPTPEIFWLYNNNKIESKMAKADMSVFYNEREAVLRLGNANRDLEGSYTCKAVNAAGVATSACVLTIKEIAKPPTPALPEKSKPAFYVPLKNQVIIILVISDFNFYVSKKSVFQHFMRLITYQQPYLIIWLLLLIA